MLTRDTYQLFDKFPREFIPKDFNADESTVKVLPEHVVDGRKCAAVEIALPEYSGRPKSTTRMYFAEDLGYACVKIESAFLLENRWVIASTWTMGDFREVKPGLFVPFSASTEDYDADGETGIAARDTIEKLEFADSFDDSMFTFGFPEGMAVRDLVAHLDYVVGETAMPEGIDEILDEPEANGHPAPRPTEPPEPAFPGEPPGTAAETASPPEAGSPGRPWGKLALAALALIVVVVIVAAVVLVGRKRR